MRYFTFLTISIIAMLGSLSVAQVQSFAQSSTLSCNPVPGRQARIIAGEVSQGDTFSQPLTANWTFKLLPAPHGWDLRLVDVNGLDLSQITPPFRFAPNAREIYGWHFRNAANTDINTGDVNAPQHLRLFFFDPALTGTGGLKPSDGVSDPNSNAGRGALTILDMELTGLEPGGKATISYLKFVGCVSWTDEAEAAALAPATEMATEIAPEPEVDMLDPAYIDEEYETMYGCGLDSEKYQLSAWTLPRMIGGDFDGDGAGDDVAPIIRISDGRRGIALCRAGTWMSVLGYEADDDIPLKTEAGEPKNEIYASFAQYLDITEYWEVRGANDEANDDILILGRTEKAEVEITWNGKQFAYVLARVVISE